MPKIGLLQCDHVEERHRDTHGNYQNMFNNLFPSLDLVEYDVYNGVFPNSPHECDGYLSTGSGHAAYEDLEWIFRLKSFVADLYAAEKPYVGVCFGHQILAEALGGKVEKARGGWCVGVHTFQVNTREPWMDPFRSSVNLLMCCEDQIIRLPEKGLVIASTPQCPVAVLKVGENMLGVQAHPEFSKAYNEVLMSGRMEKIGQRRVTQGMESLNQEIDRELVAAWILHFFNSR